VIIVHRLSTVKDADNIVVMSPEGIVEQGRYAELMARRGAFYNLQDTQLMRETLDVPRFPAFGRPATATSSTTELGVAPSRYTETESLPSAVHSRTQLMPKEAVPPGTIHANSTHTLPELEPTHTSKHVWQLSMSYNRPSSLLGAFGIFWALMTGCSSTVQAHFFLNVSLPPQLQVCRLLY
jgi:hypothetical protein